MIDEPTHKPFGGYSVSSEPPEPIRQPCCTEWQHAHEGGTDNEMYGALIGYAEAGTPQMGDCFTISFCPFCGVPKTAVKS